MHALLQTFSKNLIYATNQLEQFINVTVNNETFNIFFLPQANLNTS